MAEAELDLLLSGKGWPVPEEYDAGPPPPHRPVRLRRNTCYVVMAVLLNEKVRREGGRVGPGCLPSSPPGKPGHDCRFFRRAKC